MSEIGAPKETLVFDAATDSFAQDVIAASRATPVIVDFWAPWCEPCKQLTPLLESAVQAAGGKVKLAKVNVDENQMLAGQMGVRSIPHVVAFADGRPVDGFAGAVPESQIKEFIARLTAGSDGGASDIEAALDAAEAALEAGDPAGASQVFAQLAEAPDHGPRAIAGLARCRIAAGQPEEARQLLEMIEASARTAEPVARAFAELALASADGEGDDLDKLASAVEADPADMQARYDLAEALLGAKRFDEAVDHLLAAIAQDNEWNEGAARLKLLTVFEALGPKNETTLRGRRRLSSLLFS